MAQPVRSVGGVQERTAGRRTSPSFSLDQLQAAAGPLKTSPAPTYQGPGAGTTITAQKAPEVERLYGKYEDWLSGLGKDTGLEMDLALSRIRDLGEGERKAITQSAKLRGIASTPALTRQSEKTQANVSEALQNLALEREKARGSAILSGESLASKPTELALSEKSLGLQASALDLQERQFQHEADMNKWRADLDAQLQNLQTMLTLASYANSPTYTGF